LEQPLFGQRLRELRLQRGLSQAALAGVGMSAGYLSRLESGLRPPTPTAVDYLADRIGVPVSAFEEPLTTPADEELAKGLSAEDGDDATESLGAAAGSEQASPALRWLALWHRAQLQARLPGSPADSATAQQLLSLSDELKVPELQARSRVLQARLLRSEGNMASAYQLAIEAHTLGTEHGLPPTDRLRALLVLISTEAEIGRVPDALVHLSDVDSLLPSANRRIAVDALWTSASVLVRHGDFNRAVAKLQEALARLDSRDDLKLWLRLRLAAASLNLQMNPPRPADAERLLGEAEAALHLVGSEQQQVEFKVITAHLRFAQHRIEEADGLCRSVGDGTRELALRDRIRFEVLTNQILILRGRGDLGVPAIENLAKQAHDGANIDLAAEIWRNLAETLAAAQSLRQTGAGAGS
jgi:transcriptional regulator with XRE-family HTH domain